MDTGGPSDHIICCCGKQHESPLCNAGAAPAWATCNHGIVLLLCKIIPWQGSPTVTWQALPHYALALQLEPGNGGPLMGAYPDTGDVFTLFCIGTPGPH